MSVCMFNIQQGLFFYQIVFGLKYLAIDTMYPALILCLPDTTALLSTHPPFPPNLRSPAL